MLPGHEKITSHAPECARSFEVVMSLAKLGAGEGYEYYLRNTATNDINDRGPNQDLSGYYSERGEAPGRWIGSGLGNVGITVGDAVAESQMRALYGHGLHPNAEAMIAAEIEARMAEGISYRAAKAHALVLAQLGRPFTRYARDEYSFRLECRRAFEAHNLAAGRVDCAPIPEQQREQIRTEVAERMFTEELGRAPLNARELSGWIARASRAPNNAVSGYDLTFSPVKSISVVWALGSPEVAAIVEAAHHAGITDALAYLERNAIYTRRGRHSVRQIDVSGGLIATAFDHRDSRAGDPDLHTHVVVSNKVLGADGQWSSVDGRMLYRNNVAASEIYNTRVEHHLEQALGVRFADRAARRGKRPVREVVGVDLRLAEQWSKRSTAIDAELTRLTQRFAADHGREPTGRELLDLGQQATLATRGAKPAARSRDQQRTDWRRDADQILGAGAVEEMLTATLNQPAPRREQVDVADTAAQVVAAVSESRATWQITHVRAETERHLRGRLNPDQWADTVTAVTDAALSAPYSIPRGTPTGPGAEAGVLTRHDGTSVYTAAGSLLYTSSDIVAAEARLVAASLRTGGRTLPTEAVDTALVEFAANHNGAELNPAQEQLVREFARSGARLQVAIAPAGTGKTTAMSTLARAWTSDGATVVGLAPTGSAAATLAAEIDAHTATVDMLVTLTTTGRPDPELPEWVRDIGPGTLVILDEAGKTPTLKLDAAVSWLLERGASIRAVGDDRQLSSVAAGGVIRDIVHHAGAISLTRVVRFADPAEQAASLALREGDPAALAHYADHGRIHVGTLGDAITTAFRAWRTDTRAGRDSALLAPTRDLVARLNVLARDDRIARTGVTGPEVTLADGLSASVGDIITTRRNDYRLWLTRTDHVRNGYRWTVRTVHDDGRVTAAHLGSGQLVTLPADYVTAHTELGYATTIDTAQGLTVDTCHGVLTGRETRAQLYVLASRAREGNHLYVATAGTGDPTDAYTWRGMHPPTALDLLTGVLAREGTQTSATSAERESRDPHQQLAAAVDAYLDALTATASAVLGTQHRADIAAAAERLVPGLTQEEAWPVLQQTLSLTALAGRDPVTVLADAVHARELTTADDKAAVLDWRIGHATGGGPLDRLPAIPATLRTDPTYGGHLNARETQIRDLAAQITRDAHAWTRDTAPTWAAHLYSLDADLTGELAVWRAAHAVPDTDRRPTGPRCYPVDERTAQARLDARVAETIGDLDVHTRRWAPLAREVDERLLTDPYWPDLAAQLSKAEATGHDTATAVRAAAAERPLPYDQPAAALHWRLTEPLGEAGDPERIREFLRADPVRRLDDRQLKEAVGLRRRLLNDPAGVGLVHVMGLRQAEEDLQALTDRYDECLAQVEPLETAVAAQQARAKVVRARQVAEREFHKAKQDYEQTSKLRWKERERLAGLRDAARERCDELRDAQDQAEANLAEAASEVAGASSGWADQLRQVQQTIEDYPDRLATAEAKVELAEEILADDAQQNTRTQEQLDTLIDEQRRRGDLPTALREAEQRLRTEITDPADRQNQTWGYDFRPTPTPKQARRERDRYRDLNPPGHSHEPTRGHGYGL